MLAMYEQGKFQTTQDGTQRSVEKGEHRSFTATDSGTLEKQIARSLAWYVDNRIGNERYLRTVGKSLMDENLLLATSQALAAKAKAHIKVRQTGEGRTANQNLPG